MQEARGCEESSPEGEHSQEQPVVFNAGPAFLIIVAGLDSSVTRGQLPSHPLWQHIGLRERAIEHDDVPTAASNAARLCDLCAAGGLRAQRTSSLHSDASGFANRRWPSRFPLHCMRTQPPTGMESARALRSTFLARSTAKL
jgi:hypothetical protein